MTHQLLRRYVAERSETAFAELVRQHIDLVYSAALRQVNGDAAAAQDVAQEVFTDLARKAPRLTGHSSLAGWLYTSTRFVASKARRAEKRRRAREQEAYAMNQLLNSTPPDPTWQELRPLLDDAMQELGAVDREAVLMRYFERRPLAEVGTYLGLSENAARMRVERALHKLRRVLARRGMTSTVLVLSTILTEHAVTAAPAGFAAQLGHSAFVAGVAGAGIMTGLANLLAPIKVPLLIGVTAVGLMTGWHLLDQKHLPTDANAAGPQTVLPTSQPSVATAADSASAAIDSSATSSVADTNKLVLHIVAADSGKAVPLVELDYWLWLSGKVSHKKPLRANHLGVCEVPVPRDTVTELILVSRIDGFADTRLEWHPERGMIIPELYTLPLARSAPIGGLVVDSDGKPVSGAEVGFNNQVDPSKEKLPESNDFGWPFWISTTTDANGRWKMDRIAADTLQTIYGSASHPEQVGSETLFLDRKPEAKKELLAGTYVFHLGHAVTARGVVISPDGQTIPDAHVLIGDIGSSGGRETNTMVDGTFAIAGCKPGTNSVTAEAKGFAPATILVDLEDNSSAITLTLQPGKLLRLRVVDQQGAPVPKARVWLDSINGRGGFPGASAAPRVQADFTRQTDPDGRIEWDSAPDQELTFDISARGYMNVNDVKITPDGQEHSITMPPAVTISGTVRDAQSGESIPKFRIITGWPESNIFSGTTNNHWSSLDRFWLSFEGGQFHHVFEEQALVTTPNPGYVFKFEAEGYAPFVTRVVAANETDARFDVAMRPAVTTSVCIALPDGRPAANADVGLVSPGSRLQLRAGSFARDNQSSGSLLTADSQGRFNLPPDDSIKRIIVAHPEGYGEGTPAQLADQPTLVLQPWGRLEGTFFSSGKPVEGRSVMFQYGSGELDGVYCDFQAYQKKTHADGKFVFAQVPPGNHSLVEMVPVPGSPGPAWRHEPLLDVEIRPGQTTTVTLGVSGYTITARPRWPAELPRAAGWAVFASVHSPAPTPPFEATNNPAALAAWRSTPAFRNAIRRLRYYQLKQTPDGVFTAENVPPGEYVATVTANEPSTNGQPRTVAGVDLPVTVPADPPSGTLDLGELALQPTQ